MVFGTPEFMSPEQAQGKTLDARSDVYSLAVILYGLLTGKLPFDARSPMEFITLHVQTTPIPLSRRAPERAFPPGLEDVILQAMAKRPEDRYQSAGEFATALASVVPEGSVREAMAALPDSAIALAATQPSRPAMRSENAPPAPLPAQTSVVGNAPRAVAAPVQQAPAVRPRGLPVAALILIGVIIGLVLSLGVLGFFLHSPAPN